MNNVRIKNPPVYPTYEGAARALEGLLTAVPLTRVWDIQEDAKGSIKILESLQRYHGHTRGQDFRQEKTASEEAAQVCFPGIRYWSGKTRRLTLAASYGY